MRIHALIIFLLVFPLMAGAQEPKRRFIDPNFFYCTAVETILAKLAEEQGNQSQAKVHYQQADDALQDGKKDMVAVGRNPSGAERIVQTHLDRFAMELEKAPASFPIVKSMCKTYQKQAR